MGKRLPERGRYLPRPISEQQVFPGLFCHFCGTIWAFGVCRLTGAGKCRDRLPAIDCRRPLTRSVSLSVSCSAGATLRSDNGEPSPPNQWVLPGSGPYWVWIAPFRSTGLKLFTVCSPATFGISNTNTWVQDSQSQQIYHMVYQEERIMARLGEQLRCCALSIFRWTSAALAVGTLAASIPSCYRRYTITTWHLAPSSRAEIRRWYSLDFGRVYWSQDTSPVDRERLALFGSGPAREFVVQPVGVPDWHAFGFRREAVRWQFLGFERTYIPAKAPWQPVAEGVGVPCWFIIVVFSAGLWCG